MELEPIGWGTRSLEEPDRTRLRCGRLLVEFSKVEDEICLASRNLSEEEFESLDETAPVEWTRWAVCTGTEEVRIAPGLPRLPVMVDPEDSFHVVPGAEARIYVRIPLSVVVRLTDKFDQLLGEFPTETLSQTWFGETDNGELCYWLSSRASRRTLDELDEAGIQAPVTIHNDSAETLQVSRLCLRVGGLSIYRSGDSLWTNETTIRFQGGAVPSKVAVKSGPPKEAAAAHLISGPREAGPSTAMARTFRSLRRWTVDLLDIE
ncbi:MAG: DUF432 domain-containing protein [Verrucomicrobiales bacterium]